MSDSNSLSAGGADSRPGPSSETLEQSVHGILSQIEDGHIDEALDLTQALAKSAPEQAEPYYLLGLAAVRLGDSGRAIELLQMAHKMDPDCKEYADVLGVVCTRVGKLTDGLYFAKLAMALKPHPLIDYMLPPGMDDYFQALSEARPPRYIVRAMTLLNARLFERTVEQCGLALRLDSGNTSAHLLLAKALMEMHEPDRAVAALHTVVHLDPAHTEARVLLADCLDRLGRRDEADETREAAAALDPDSVLAAAAAVRAAAFRHDVTPARIAAAEDRAAACLDRARAAAGHDAPVSMFKQDASAPRPERMRIGYIGAAFHDSPDAAFFRDVISSHNRANAEIFVYQESVNQNELVVQLQALTSNWREIYDLTPDVAASIISGDGIDMLIDLSGYSAEMPLTVMALKPAKKQVGWLNHLNGAGSRTIDVVLSDPMTKDIDNASLQDGQAEAFIESGLLAMSPPEMFNPVGESPGRETGRVTFASAADLRQITPRTARVWAEILRAAPGSRLVLRDMVRETDTVTGHITEMFAHFGVVDQVKFFRSERDVRIDSVFFEGIDIYLDSFPVSRPEDAVLSLWSGAPVVTLKGPTRMGRFGACVLNSAGRNEWIADDEAAYKDIAVNLAGDLDALAETRAGLRESVREKPLFKPDLLARGIEAVAGLMLRDVSADG
ncbi:MAG: O-linked N-acetylglucosamine transferase, SPINDLY family protein [Rhodospirillales bacterium]